MIYFDSDMSKSRNTVVCFDWKTVIYIYVCGKCRTQFMLPMEKSVTFTGACADEIIPNGSLAGLLIKRKKEELRIYWCSTRFPYYMPFVSFNSKTMDVSSGTGPAYSSVTPQFILVCFRVNVVLCLVYCVVFSWSLLVFSSFFCWSMYWLCYSICGLLLFLCNQAFVV